MNLAALEAELGLIVQDSSLQPYFRDWLNQAVEELAADFCLPSLRVMEPYPLGVYKSQWLYNLPDNYQKGLFRVCRGPDKTPVTILQDMAYLEALDINHIATGNQVTKVAVSGRQIGVYPLADDTLWLWYYRQPVPMENPEDEPDGIPVPYRARVLIPKVVIKNFRLLQDLMTQPPHQSLAWWTEEYRNGLYGSPRGEIGLLNFFAREKRPRRHGGRDPLP